MEHLSLEIFDLTGSGSKYAVLPEDASITITDTSEIFASGDMWSHSFQLNVKANAHIFGTTGDMHGSRLHEQIHKRRARLWVEGLPLYMGYLTLGDEVDVDEDGNVDVAFESGQKTFDEMIEGAKANQVPLMGDVPIGMALWRKRWTEMSIILRPRFKIGQWANFSYGHDDTITEELRYDGEDEGNSMQQYPRMVYPKGSFVDDSGTRTDIDYINTDYPYDDAHPYCNVALCYQRSGYDKKDQNGNIYQDYSGEPEPQRGYDVMPANRVNSAPNFFVIYWVKALMKHLGIYIEENQMMDVEDLRRLFFVNTKCAYEEPKALRNRNKAEQKYGRYTYADGKRILAEYLDPNVMVGKNESKFQCKSYTIDGIDMDEGLVESDLPGIEDITVTMGDISGWNESYYKQQNYLFHKAFASKECFPDVDISEVIKAVENGFGVRFLFSDNFQRVRIVLLKNIFSSSETQDISCDIISEAKTENSIRGFRMTYGAGTDNTEFYYKGFADKLPHKKPYFIDDSDKHDYSHWDLDAQYDQVIKKVSAFDKTCYVTANNGDAYGIKVDKDAKRYDELHPSLFEFAGYMDAEDGDCTGESETIEEINVGFTPAIMNDTNFEDERSGSTRLQKFALFVDAEMKPRRCNYNDEKDRDFFSDPEEIYNIDELYRVAREQQAWSMGDGTVAPGLFTIRSDMYIPEKTFHVDIFTWILKDVGEYFDGEGGATLTEQRFLYAIYHLTLNIDGIINEGYRLYLQDNYTPNDDGICPVETKDWGLTLGIMRGSGSDAHVAYEDDPDDGENNATWKIEPGSNATVHPDTCDSYGNEWDYDGSTLVYNSQDAIAVLPRMWPDSNIDPIHSSGTTMRARNTYISHTELQYVTDNSGNKIQLLFAFAVGMSHTRIFQGTVKDYVARFNGKTPQEMYAYDAGAEGQHILIEVDSNRQRQYTFEELEWMAFIYTGTRTYPIVVDENTGIGAAEGRFSLKLRAEKPNPYYVKTLPQVITTKTQAAEAMKKLYTTADPDLLNRPLISNETLRQAGWEVTGDGYATIFGVGIGIELSDGRVHEILWTPIRTNGVVMTPQQLNNYTVLFHHLSLDNIKTVDVLNMVLDIDTTEERAEILHQLQELYYAPEGTDVPGVDISSLNRQYLEIDNPNLRNRGLADKFYKEYSYWVRNARICKRTVRMDLAQLLAIDKTKKVRVGDITGFIRKTQYAVSKKTGLGMVTMEIMYI